MDLESSVSCLPMFWALWKSSNACMFIGVCIYLNREWQAGCNTILYDWVSLKSVDRWVEIGVFQIKIKLGQ